MTSQFTSQMNLQVQTFFDPATFTLTYVVWDESTRDAVVLDSVMDYDPSFQALSRASLRRVDHFLRAKNLRLGWVLETHAHADHLTAGRELRAMHPGALWGMGRRLSEVFATFKSVFKWPVDLQLGGSGGLSGLGVDRFFGDGEEFCAGSIVVQALETPGHTPACLTYRIGDWLFTGDALMLPDAGVGRCDFPGGSASSLYDSIWGKLYALPDHLVVFAGHDYQPGGRPLRWRCSLGEQKAGNVHLRSSVSRADFVAFREGRDKTLSAPRLLAPSLDWNLGAHQLIPRFDL